MVRAAKIIARVRGIVMVLLGLIGVRAKAWMVIVVRRHLRIRSSRGDGGAAEGPVIWRWQ